MINIMEGLLYVGYYSELIAFKDFTPPKIPNRLLLLPHFMGKEVEVQWRG